MDKGFVSLPRELSLLEEAIGYKFANANLLCEAMTHSSYANEKKDGTQSNERLEFLGDSVLSAIVSEFIYLRFPDKNEGELSNIRREIIDSQSLAAFAGKISLGDYLLLGHGEEQSGGRQRRTNLEDAFEALTAAVYLDGGRVKAKKFVLSFVSGTADSMAKSKLLTDPKTLLQEIVQQKPGELLEYVITGEEGPDHDKRFTCQARLNSNVIGEGIGKSKKEAEKNAARVALGLFGIEID